MHILQGRNGLRTRLLTCGALGALATAAVLALPAQAQTTTPAPAAAAPDGSAATEVVVTGIRKSIARAIANKRTSDSIIESVTAEDVGKLPGESITESLALLPGVTAQRLDGRADILSVRGFGPDFTNTLFNHREIATTGDDRGFQYDQIPSELINRGDVIKTPSATLVGQGLAGTVDLMTIDPLLQKSRILSASVRGEVDGYSKENPDLTNSGYRGSVIYVDKFDNDKIGVSAGFTTLSSPQQEKQYDAWGFPTDSKGNYILGGAKYFATSSLEKRQSAFARLEYQPDSKFELALDAFYSHFTTDQDQRGLEVPMAWGSGPAATNITTVNGFDTQATFSGVNSVQRNNYNGRKADTLALGLNGQYHFSDSLKLTVDASYSRAARKDTDLETYTGLGYNHAGQADTITVTQQSNGTYQLNTALNYDDPTHFVLTDPQGWGYNGTSTVVQAGFLNAPKFVDEIKALRGELEGDVHWGIFSSWQLGANYSDRTKTAGFKSWFLNPGPTIATTQLAIPSSLVVGGVTPFELGNGQTLALNALGVANLLTNTFDNRPSSLARDYFVEEKVATEYAQLNIDGNVGVPVRGNLGLQVVSTDQSSTGQSASLLSVTDPTTHLTTGQVVLLPVSGGAKYTDVLPSLNLIFDVADGSVVRAGLARSLSRARQEDMEAPFTYSGSAAPSGTLASGKPYYFTGSGGNPELRPYLSDNADISFEHYFAHNAGIIQVDFFYKKLHDYVDPNNSVLVDFASVASALVGPTAAATIGSNTIGVVTAPANTGTGRVKGAEVNLALPLTTISPVLDGFGILFNGAYTSSSVRYGNGSPITVPGLSNIVETFQLYYEKHGFQFRTSYSYRSKFLGETSTVTQAASLSEVASTKILDAQIGYEFQTGPLKGMSIVLQGQNLTDAPFITYQGNDPRQVINYEKYGPTYMLGVTKKF